MQSNLETWIVVSKWLAAKGIDRLGCNSLLPQATAFATNNIELRHLIMFDETNNVD